MHIRCRLSAALRIQISGTIQSACFKTRTGRGQFRSKHHLISKVSNFQKLSIDSGSSVIEICDALAAVVGH